MIKHIIMWKLHDRAEGFSKLDNAKRIKTALKKMTNEIPEINHSEIGINFCKSEHAYDIVMICEFNSRSDLEKYQKHPAHLELIKFIKTLRSERHVVDYEICE